MTDPVQEATMERILQEITAVGRRLEEMDSAVTSLTAETISRHLDIAGSQSRVTGLEQRVTTMEDHINTAQDRDQELLYLRCKLIDLEDRSRRDNFNFLGFLEYIEGTDTQYFLRAVLPKVTELTFNTPLEFQRAHQLSPKLLDGSSRPRPIIACLLRHRQTRQLLLAARAHRLIRAEGYEVHITADFSKQTNDCRKAFFAPDPSYAN
ncbi:hypothetical protein NDU88_000109 [Pleurodeles waltl]|uniref:Uncharacterized protein n=1 Tax=Pleurodeles waltl TaxID=8319 RepID=A0AAV7L9A0_PLEWA|nr:hypothetical protein NDU88_000109 [Pleurodeles waltl]